MKRQGRTENCGCRRVGRGSGTAKTFRTAEPTFFAFYVLYFIAFSFVAAPSHADDSVSLPLHGYYHPGKYMPVDVAITPRSAVETSVKLAAPGSVWTYVRFEGGRIDTTVPWMPVDERATALEWYVWPRSGGAVVEPMLKPLDEHQRLVGYAGVDAEAARTEAALIYPGNSLIVIPLNPAMPLPGSAAAWETLDAVVLDPAAALRVGESRFANLISGGVVFAIRADAGFPNLWPYWPWKQEGNWQVLRFQPAGPLAATYSEAIYNPVSSWRSGWPGEVRRGFMAMLAIYSILVLMLALWKPRAAAVGAMMLSVVLLIGVNEWAKHRKPTQTAGGKVRIVSSGITQDDDWAYQVCHQDTTSVIGWVDTTRIMFASAAQLDRTDARIVCYPNGDPDLLFFKLPARMKIAMLSRRCGPQAPSITPRNSIVTSPLATLVNEVYLSPADQLLGEFPCASLISERYAAVQQWQGVMIRRFGAEK